MRIKAYLAAFLLFVCAAAHAQFTPGQILTAAQLNSQLALKTSNAAAAITGGTITGATITGLSAPIGFASGGTNATTATGATNQLQYLQGATGSVARSVTSKLQDVVTPKDFGAQGDGVTNDTSAFAALESQYTGRVVDLLGLTYVVAAVPTLNAYHNGSFSVAGAREQAAMFRSFASSKSKFHAYGGQLRALHKSLSNPLEQQTTITFIGDSITWGLNLPENGPQGTRNGTLQDQRDVFTSPSFVNEFKRYVGAQYFSGASPVLSNWSYSAGGQSTASYSRYEELYTNLPPFTVATSSATSADTNTAGTLLGYRHALGINPSGSTATVTFQFTGQSLDIYFTSISAAGSAGYTLYVNGVSQGTFTTWTGSAANQQKRTHNFSYVRNATIQIAATYVSGNSGVAYLNLEGIGVNKTVTIVNQGIIGTTAYLYNFYDFGAFGPSVMTPDVNYVFIQLGTNDRANNFPSYSQPNGINNFQRNLTTLIGQVTPTASVILMNALPAALDSPPTYVFNTQDIRNVVDQVGSANSLDVIDNNTIFQGMGNSVYSSDGLHPNLLGHAMIVQNIINALESN